MNFQNHYFESLETVFKIKLLKFFDAVPESRIFLEPGSGMGYVHTGWKNSDPG